MSMVNSRKRASTENEDSTSVKVPRNMATAKLHVKILVPSTMAGILLGKKGETISQIQHEAQIRAHISKSDEFFPNTNDRICLLAGNDIDCIKKGVTMVCDRLFEKMEQPEKMLFRILVPNSTAGMIIGKGGEQIKIIKDNSKANVRLTKKDDLPERCVIIEGAKDSVLEASYQLVDIIAQDPYNNSCFQINYNYVNSNANNSGFGDYGSSSSMRTGDLKFSFNFLSPKISVSSRLPVEIVDYIGTLLKGGGYRDNAIYEIMDAIEILLRYGVLNINGDTRSDVANDMLLPPGGGYGGQVGIADNGLYGGRFGSGGGGSASSGLGSSTFEPGLPWQNATDEAGPYVRVQIPDFKMGAILGIKGQTLTEIQQRSKAQVRVSKKDKTATNADRIVMVYGHPRDIEAAKELIELKLQEFDMKHARRNN